jgi:hypothetical protein
MLAATLVLAVVSVAGAIGLERQLRRGPAPRQTEEPALVFVRGTLTRDHQGNWQLQDGTRLSFGSDVVWREERTGQASGPATGRIARLTGQFYGRTLFVRHATLVSYEEAASAMTIKGTLDPTPPDQSMPR